jgi:uncharacterized protein (UPF0218 family)
VAVRANPMQLKLGIEKAVEAVVADLKRVSVPVKGHEDVAYIAAISSRTRRPASPSQMQWTRSARTG